MKINEKVSIDNKVKNVEIMYLVTNKFSIPVTLINIERKTVKPGGTALTLKSFTGK